MSELEKTIERSVMATQRAPDALRTDGPVWWNSETKTISENLLIAYLIDQHGLIRTGSRILNSAGKLVRQDTLRKIVWDEISPVVPQGTAQKVGKLAQMLRDSVPEKKTAFAFESFTAADLATMEIPATPFVIDHILPSGLTLFAAPPKTGKSWLCLAMADAVATGGLFWGYHVTPGSVLYLALEDNKKRLQERLRAIGSDMPDNLHMVCRNAMCLDNGLMDQLSAWINEHPDTRLIILDTLQRIKGAAQRGVDAYTGDYARLGPLQELAIEKGVAIVAVHHFRKQGNNAGDDIFERIAGSTALFGVADCGWVISGKRGAEEMDFHLTGREVFDEEFKIKFENSRWQMLGNSDQLEEQRRIDTYKTSPLVRTIKELVKESGGRWTGTATAIQQEVMARTKSVPATSDRELKRIIFDIQDQLLKNDGIAATYNAGGRKGRGYTFETARQQSLMGE